MAEEIWTIAKTGVLKPDESENLVYWQREQFEQENCTWRFGSFEGARYAFRGIVAGFVETKSTVFDGRGNIPELVDMLEGWRKWYDEFGPATVERNLWMLPKDVPDYSNRPMAGDFEAARMMPAMLRAWLLDMGAFKRNPLPTFRWTDWAHGIVSTPSSIALGCTCGVERIEMYDTQIYTNAFDMSDPDGDYEFSVRNYFDVYDPEEGRSLRLRLAKGPVRKGGRFLWPEEDEDQDFLFDDAPAPCLRGMIDSSESLYIVARGPAGESAGAALGEYRSFVEKVLAHAEERGFTVKRKLQPSHRGDLSNDEADLYQAGDDCAWSHVRLTASLGPRRGGRTEAPVRIGSVDYDGFDEALAGAMQRIDEHLERMRERKWPMD